ncbi:MAG: hypothetical protein IKU44_05035 [Firmicutes bacterium]|nr:hypothetical protein [Bacillota bacterium]
MKPSERLRNLSTKNVMAAIEMSEFCLFDMDRKYEAIRNSDDVEKELETTFDDLISLSMEMAFLEGMKFQKRVETLLEVRDE